MVKITYAVVFGLVKSSLFVSIAVGLAKFLCLKLCIFSYPSVLMYVLGAQKYRLNEMVLLSTHNICFGGKIRKISFDYTILTRGLYYLCCSNWTSKKFPLFVSIAVGLAKFLCIKL